MSRYAEPMARLIEELKKLPGVGSKSAQRFAFHILRSSNEDAAALAEAVENLKASLRLCSICNNVTDVDPCAYCAGPTRNQRVVCVVEEPTNIESVERTRSYQGVYHVLHGTLSPLHGVGEYRPQVGVEIHFEVNLFAKDCGQHVALFAENSIQLDLLATGLLLVVELQTVLGEILSVADGFGDQLGLLFGIA